MVIRAVLGSLRLEMLPVIRRLPAYSRLALALLREPDLRTVHKIILAGGVAYLLSPIDLIPGFIPILGQLDDLSVALWTLRRALRAIPSGAADRHLAAHGLTLAEMDADLARVGRSGRLVVRAGLQIGQRMANRVERTWLRVGLTLLERRGFPRRLTA
jgi:uncharacterized membrane protein YkvA (DUF1232 family)